MLTSRLAYPKNIITVPRYSYDAVISHYGIWYITGRVGLTESSGGLENGDIETEKGVLCFQKLTLVFDCHILYI